MFFCHYVLHVLFCLIYVPNVGGYSPNYTFLFFVKYSAEQFNFLDLESLTSIGYKPSRKFEPNRPVRNNLT
jgi:hypothetical protein